MIQRGMTSIKVIKMQGRSSSDQVKTRMAENFKEPLDDYHFDRDHYDSCNLYICIPWFYVGSIRRCRSITSSGSQSR